MKIVHICLAAPYVDGWGYQENLLPKYLANNGVNSVVITSNILPDYLNNKQVATGSYVYEGVKVIRLRSKRFGSSLTYAKGLHEVLEQEKPDAIFHHNINFLSHIPCAKYCIKQGIPMFVDNHADYINSMKNSFLRFILYRCINGNLTNLYSKPVVKFFGVTHSRCRFLYDVFGIDKSKVDFLPIGADVNAANTLPAKNELRTKFKIQQDEFTLVSGGKMGVDKGTVDLIQAVEELNQAYHRVKLILFGKFTDSVTEDLAKSKSFIKLYGWCDRKTTLELLATADLACWPIHHTTLCEDSIACKTPLLIRKTETTEHLIDGNGYFLQVGDKEELKNYIKLMLTADSADIIQIERSANTMCKKLSYNTISQNIMQQVLEFQDHDNS